MTIAVLVNGAGGRMGQASVAAIRAQVNMIVVAECRRADDLAAMIKKTQPAVVLDFTDADSVLANAKLIIEHNVHPVIGTSGLLAKDITQLQMLCATKKLGGIIVPNFCIGAALMVRFVAEAAKYYSHAEIIELHHDKKLDAPSGTAIKTAAALTEVRNNRRVTCKEIVAGARGASVSDVPIHSVRLPGLLAHQEVLFGSAGELLTIRHDSFSREAYMPGVCLAIEKVLGLSELVYGLENIV